MNTFVFILELLARYGAHMTVCAIFTVLLVGMLRGTQRVNRAREEMRRHVSEL